MKKDTLEGAKIQKNTGSRRRLPKKALWAALGLIILAGAAGGYLLWSRGQQADADGQAASLKTAQVRRGSLMLSASGSGTLLGGRETSLVFPTAGTIASVSVQAGDTVQEGQELARLAEVESLTTSLKVAELQLMAAEKTLADLQGSSASGLASARLAVEEAKDAVADAESALKTKGLPRCDKDTTDAYYSVYLRAKDSREALSDEGGTTGEYYLAVIVPAKDAEANAYAAYRYCAKFSDYEIAASEAELTLARAALKIAEEDLAMMLENKGIDPQELAGADNDVSAARLSYEQALKNLEGSTMRAPFDGTILSVAGETGETVGTTTFIVIADLLHPQVQFSVDETDLDKVSVGNGAEVIFDALPERVFEGQVVQVDPSLQTSSGYSVLQGLISLDLSAEANPKLFVVGMSGAVDVIGGEALDALLVPIEAVRDLGDGSYGVFVLDDDGKPRLRVVEVGLMDATYAEIKTGLEQGDTVTTGAVETNS